MSTNIEPQPQKLRGPIFSITHGAGPLPLEGQQDSLLKVWNQLSTKILAPSRPDAVVVISAHYHSEKPKVMVPKNGEKYFTLKFDYSGFPAQCYKYQFAPRGHPGIANAILEEMKKMPILADAELDDETGCLDHGTWVPMIKMLPTKHGEEIFSFDSNNNNVFHHYSQQHQHHSVASNRTACSYLSAPSSFTSTTATSSRMSSSAFSTTSTRASSSGGVSTTSLQYCDIPIVPVSVSASSDPAVQLAIGEAIRLALLKPLPSSSSSCSSISTKRESVSTSTTTPALGERKINTERAKSVSIVSDSNDNNCGVLKQQNRHLPKVAIIASGSINHNFRRQVLFGVGGETNKKNKKQNNNFNENLKHILSDESISPESRKEMMMKWRSSIPGNSLYQPVHEGKNGSADHFMPMLSVIAASGYQPISGSLTYDYFGMPCSDFIWK